MAIEQGIFGRFARLRVGCALLVGFFASVSVVSAQYPAQYPSQSQVSKDGTAVLLEDFVNPPVSSPTHGGVATAPLDYKGQLGRMTSLRSEPSNAPLAASRIFVNDQ